MITLRRVALLSLPLALLGGLTGCETNGWLIDPQRTGYFETTPTAIPILTRIDVIEQAADTSVEFTQPTAEDLVPVQLEYRLASGDIIKVSIPQLVSAEQTDISTRVVDQAGRITLPIIGQVQAAGQTVPELENEIKRRLKDIITNPKAFVSVEEGRAYQFRVLGSVEQPGLFGLNKPDLRVLDALALARGAAPTTTRILITRQKATDSAGGSTVAQPEPQQPSQAPGAPAQPGSVPAPAQPTAPSASDIDALINELPTGSAPQPKPTEPQSSSAPAAEAPSQPAAEPSPAAVAPTPAPAAAPAPESPANKPVEPSAPPPAPPAPAPTTDKPVDPASQPASEPASQPASPPAGEPAANPSEPAAPKPARLGMLASSRRAEPPVDIDSLEPAKATDSTPASQVADEGDRFTFDTTSQTWVKVGKSQATPATSTAAAENPSMPGLKTGEAARSRAKNEAKKAITSRVIEIDYNALVRGSSNLNVVIHPDDMIYCDQGDVGVVYIDGVISRPGVYNLPTSGRLTLSRLVAAAGGLGELAIPQRVDLVRRIGVDKEACIRVNLAAIRNRAEPDIFMKPDDHVHIGTNFWATPLAVIRNGFRMTYGFGFLVDRNWGNDIFGPPPTNVLGQ